MSLAQIIENDNDNREDNSEQAGADSPYYRNTDRSCHVDASDQSSLSAQPEVAACSKSTMSNDTHILGGMACERDARRPA